MKENVTIPWHRTITIFDIRDASRSGVMTDRRKGLFRGFLLAVYVIRGEDDQVLYVGATHIGVRKRVKSHIYAGKGVGKFIKDNEPQSDKWLVDMYRTPDWETTLAIEAQLIKNLKPLFNKTHNHSD